MTQSTYLIASNKNGDSFMCKDNKFRLGVLSGMGKFDTIVYTVFGRAWCRVMLMKKIKARFPDVCVIKNVS